MDKSNPSSFCHWWWWPFARMRGLWRRFNDFFPANFFFFYKWEICRAHQVHFYGARISPRWLSELSLLSFSIRSYQNHHSDYSAIEHLRAKVFSFRKVVMGSLTCATILVRTVHTMVRQALTSLRKCWFGKKLEIVLPPVSSRSRTFGHHGLSSNQPRTPV